MEKDDKTYKELTDELMRLRQRVSELETLEAEYNLLKEKLSSANYDSLTGLPNRTLFYDNLTHALVQAKHNQKFVCVMFISIGRFKLINDTLGHNIGNLLLKNMTERLRGCICKSDYLARPGRDEFMLLLPEINRAVDARITAEKIFGSLNSPFKLNNNELLITVSIGLSLYPYDGEDAETLIKNSYTAMSMAKEQTKNDYKFYSPIMNAEALESLLMDNDLRLALRRKEFLLYYQPQIDLKTGRITGMEALLRWLRPGLGLINPSGFISAIEKTELIEPLGEWVIRSACEQNKAWQAAGFAPMRVAVNLSSHQFHQKSLIETIAETLRETALDPQWLDLEMTESSILSNKKSAISTMRTLKDMGVSITIDDFGTGYSSLSHLKSLPINRLKIDRSFVRLAANDPTDATITRAIVTMAHSLKLGVIAEGVETIEQLEFFRSLNCDAVQGYLFYKPLPAGEIARNCLE